MSLVGPKALFVNEAGNVERDERAGKILPVKPGITGFWQISDKGENDRKMRAEMDLYYVRNWSLWLDTVIIAKTLLLVTILKKKRTA